MLRFGFIGSGFAQFVIEPLTTIEGISVDAIAARDEGKLKLVAQKFNIPKYYTDYREMLKDPALDVIVVSTPPALHFEHAKESLLAGKHVLIEKPVCLTMSDFEELERLAAEKNVKVGVNHMMRFNKLYQTLQILLEAHLFEKPSKIHFLNMASTLPGDHWFWDRKISGGIFLEHGIHFFDLFHKIFGEGKLVSTRRYSRSSNETIEDRVHCNVEYADDLLVDFTHMFDQVPNHETTFTLVSFPNGWIKIEGWSAHKMSGDLVLARADIEKLKTSLTEEAKFEIQELEGSPDQVMMRDLTLNDPINVKFEVLNETSVLDVYKHDTLELLKNFCGALQNDGIIESSLASVRPALELALQASV